MQLQGEQGEIQDVMDANVDDADVVGEDNEYSGNDNVDDDVRI